MRIMARYDQHERMHVASVSNPDGVGMYCRKEGLKPLALIGRYGSTCGGMDTLRRNFDLVYELCEYLHDDGYNVLCEGHITAKQTWWLEKLAESRGPVVLLRLHVSLEEAMNGVAVRRAKRIGDIVPGSEKYARYQFRSNDAVVSKLAPGPVDVRGVTRQTIEKTLLQLLEIPE